MAKFYSGINTSVGIGSETLDSMLANGSTYGILPSKDIDCQDISAENVNITGVTTVTTSLYVEGKLFDGDGDFGTAGQLLSSDGTDLNWIDASTTSVANANNVGTNENSTNTDQFVAFMGASSGNNPVRVDTDLKYNPSTNVLSVKGITLPGDGQKISIGADNPLEIQHSSISSQVEFKSDAIISLMSGSAIELENEGGGNIARFVKSGGCQLFHNVSGTQTVRLETSNDGVTISGDLTADSVQLPDLKKLELGDNQELSIFHKPDTNDVRVEVESNTNYILLTKTFDLKDAGGSKAAITATNPGGVPEVVLFHDGNERLKTTDDGVTITGTVSATTFSGSGASLTNIPSSQLSGALPAIDGSNLTGISDTNTQLSTEQVQDIVGGMVSGNTESGITVTYDDAGTGTGKLNFSVINAFPSGGIIIWSGSVSNIPSGWVLCDGNNSTPDLRNRFVVGAYSDSANSAWPNLAPGHTGGAATDTVNISDTADVVFGPNATGTASKAGSSSATVSISDSDTVNTLPPYYALCYIMKT